MRSRRISRVTLPVVMIAAAAAWPAGGNAEVPFIPPGPTVVVHTSAPQDLRSPDARDAATGDAAAPAHTKADPSASDGFEWADAGIGAAIALGLMAMAGGTLLLAARTRRTA